ncbi:2-keto-3-deoxygluconate permease [Chryseolinea sp. H1M3-3]|uniref:2-keto-3-deoxygluconate permease n=1 Tax=Chryseolinea sp. H1M3-3 TaxID=3034144 RepID=UPI0023ED53EB|nr:2-keto-3-deoxygluconate permease [Chryseolinea sp. H1M3-3]
MKLKATIERIPGGMMIVPLFIGVLLNTFFPAILNIGGLTTSLAKGSGALIGAFLLCMGAGINIKSTAMALKKGAAVTLAKFLVGALLGIGVAKFFGSEGVFGLSALAIISAVTNSNGGLYAALAGEFGDETDVGAIAILSLNDGPFLTMIALGTAGLASLPILPFIGVVLPLVIGIILGNLDEELRDFLLKGGMILIPFFAFALGAGLNLRTIVEAGLPGVLLGVITTFFGGIFNVLADRAVGGTGICGAAASSTAGNAVATPAAIALIDPSLAPIVNVATSQIAAAVVTTIIFTPILTQFIAKRVRR